jgi:rSAM/selenodomain-associated transferase 1
MSNADTNSPVKHALIVMAKRPSPGRTKTRLSPPLSLEQAAYLYQCFLKDTLDLMSQVKEADPVIAYLPAEEQAFFKALAPNFRLEAQKGENLGERLDNASQRILKHGHQKVVLINSDGPTLPVAYLNAAFEQLSDDRDIVIGPSEDGGYYLIGMQQPITQILRSVEMSTPNVTQDTLMLAERASLVVHMLPEWYDVDDANTLQRLITDLETTPEQIAHHTRGYLSQLGLL